MTFELTSQNINTAEIEQSYLEEQGVGDASGLFQAYLGGEMVQEYDTQIQLFTADLTAMNAEKSSVRADKLAVSSLQADAQTVTASENYVAYDSQRNPLPYEGEAVILTFTEVAELSEQAASFGVKMNVDELPQDPHGHYAVDVKFLESIEGALDSRLTDLNSTSEMKSIQFQSLMDARKQAMIMLSNLISSDNQTKMAIIQNMKG